MEHTEKKEDWEENLEHLVLELMHFKIGEFTKIFTREHHHKVKREDM